jgi:hypothetical protein
METYLKFEQTLRTQAQKSFLKFKRSDQDQIIKKIMIIDQDHAKFDRDLACE